MAIRKLSLDTSLTERGTKLASAGCNNNVHDILTGSGRAGRALPADKDMTCGNWTKGGTDGAAMVGHEDRLGLNDRRHEVLEFVAPEPRLQHGDARHDRQRRLVCFAAN